MSEINPKTLEFNPAVFRYGQKFQFSDIEYLINRSSLANYLTFGITNEALSIDFDVLTSKGKIDKKKNDTLHNHERFDEMIEIKKKLKSHASAYGWCVGIKMKQGAKDVVRIFNAGDQANAKIKWTKTMEIESINWSLAVENEDPITGTVKNTEDYFLMGQETEKLGFYRSYLEPIFDPLFGLMNLGQQATLWGIRTGSGYQVLQVPMEFMLDENSGIRAETMKQMEQLGMNTRMFLPSEINGVPVEYKLETGDGQISFLPIRDLLLGDVTSYTGLPREKLLGSEQGLRSAETNQQAYLSRISNIQFKTNDLTKWLSPIYCDTDIERMAYKVFRELSEKESVELTKLKADTLTTLLSAGVVEKDALELLGLKVKIEKKEEPEPNPEDPDKEDGEDEKKAKDKDKDKANK